MITKEDIDALSEGNAVMDKVEERLERGIPFQREMSAKEIRPFARTAIYWRRIACNLWDEKNRADQDSMSLGPVPEKYAQKQEQ